MLDIFDKIVSALKSARETNESGITSAKLAEMIGEKVTYGGDINSTAELLKSTVDKGDLVIIMGAGDIYKIYQKLELEQ